MIKRAIVFFSLTAFGVGCQGQSAAALNSGDVQRAGATASDFSARDLEGNTVRLGPHLGKDAILLNFWQTWCEPCLQEFPHIRRMYEANKAKGFIVFGVAMDGPETVANVAPFAKRNQLTFPVLLDEDSHIASIYNPKKSAPLSVLIDKQGKIASIREGYNPGDEKYLAADVAKVLELPPPAPAASPSAAPTEPVPPPPPADPTKTPTKSNSD